MMAWATVTLLLAYEITLNTGIQGNPVGGARPMTIESGEDFPSFIWWGAYQTHIGLFGIDFNEILVIRCLSNDWSHNHWIITSLIHVSKSLMSVIKSLKFQDFQKVGFETVRSSGTVTRQSKFSFGSQLTQRYLWDLYLPELVPEKLVEVSETLSWDLGPRLDGIFSFWPIVPQEHVWTHPVVYVYNTDKFLRMMSVGPTIFSQRYPAVGSNSAMTVEFREITRGWLASQKLVSWSQNNQQIRLTVSKQLYWTALRMSGRW